MKTYASFANFKGVPATIRWFDNASGVGIVRLSDGRNAELHYSAMEGSGRDVWLTLPNQYNLACEVELLDDDFVLMVSRLRSEHIIIEPRHSCDHSDFSENGVCGDCGSILENGDR